MSNLSKLPKGFKAIAIIAILWNIMGVYSYFYHIYMPAEEIAKLSEPEQLLYKNIPKWKTIVFFIATVGGLVGSILLLLKQRFATTVLILSLIGIVVSFYYDFFKTNLLEVYGNASIGFPALVTIIGILLVWYSKKMEKQDVLY